MARDRPRPTLVEIESADIFRKMTHWLNADALKPVRLKYERASVLADEFVRERNAFVEREPYEVVADEDRKDNLILVKFVVKEAPPDHLGPILGDFIHNIRSGFNALAWLLAGSERGTQTEFPIFLSKDNYFATKKNGDPHPKSGLAKMKGFDDKAIDLVTELQPFRKENPERQALWLIHKSAIVDRHESPTLTAGVGKRAAIRFESEAKIEMIKPLVLEQALTVGEHVMAIYKTHVPSGQVVAVNMKANFDFEIAFDLDGPGRGALVPDVITAGLRELESAAADLGAFVKPSV